VPAGEVAAAAGNRLTVFGLDGGAGELKKLVAAKTGLHPDDQKVLYKDKERDSKAFLDMAGVKDRSKLVVVEDPEAKARRLIEERRNGHLEKAAKAVAAVTAEVDKLAPKVRPSLRRWPALPPTVSQDCIFFRAHRVASRNRAEQRS
jgi:hypothetical protein